MAELSKRDKIRIKKHVTNCCANYSKEYGCLPLTAKSMAAYRLKRSAICSA